MSELASRSIQAVERCLMVALALGDLVARSYMCFLLELFETMGEGTFIAVLTISCLLPRSAQFRFPLLFESVKGFSATVHILGLISAVNLLNRQFEGAIPIRRQALVYSVRHKFHHVTHTQTGNWWTGIPTRSSLLRWIFTLRTLSSAQVRIVANLYSLVLRFNLVGCPVILRTNTPSAETSSHCCLWER